jgi:hypothetical protein
MWTDMSGLLRRLPLARLLALCAAVIAAGVAATAVASALDGGPVPGSKPLADAIHDALLAPQLAGVTASIQYTNHLLEGASLASGPGGGEGLASSPLLQGATGRLWIAANGEARLELQASGGDTEVVLDHGVASIYGIAPNTVYRYTLPAAQTEATEDNHAARIGPPTVTEIEAKLADAERRATISGAEPTDIAGQPAYSVTISPKQQGSLLGAVELAWDAVHGVPLRAAVYSTESTSPVIELTASEVSYGPIEGSVFEISPAPGSKIEQLAAGHDAGAGHTQTATIPGARRPHSRSAHPAQSHVTDHGHGLSTILVDEATEPAGSSGVLAPAGLPKVNIDGATASELATALGTILTFQRSGVRYIVAGAVKPASVEAVARGL